MLILHTLVLTDANQYAHRALEQKGRMTIDREREEQKREREKYINRQIEVDKYMNQGARI